MKQLALQTIITALAVIGFVAGDVHSLRKRNEDISLTHRSLALNLVNGEQCSESGQCVSKCCVVNIFKNEVCNKNWLWRRCLEGYSFISSGDGGQCGTGGSPEGRFTIMSYNLYLFLLASDGIFSLRDRAAEIVLYFQNQRPEDSHDVVVLQEAWVLFDEIRDGMVGAGYCHYAYDDRGSFGSGMAVYSKFPIEKHDFRGFQNACASFECATDKGVIYAKVNKNGKRIHVFGTHTMFSTVNYLVRQEQYAIMRSFIDEKDTVSEMALMAGDFNEDKITTPQKYEVMLDFLHAGEVSTAPNSTNFFSYDPDENSLIDVNSPGADSFQQALDFIFYDKNENTLPPGEGSICQYIKPKDPEGDDLSDHFPVSCEIVI
eukprot:scaffold122950_cov52-Attheya_sp.AAC.4